LSAERIAMVRRPLEQTLDGGPSRGWCPEATQIHGRFDNPAESERERGDDTKWWPTMAQN